MVLRGYMPCTPGKLSGGTILMLNINSSYLFGGTEYNICIHDSLHSQIEQRKYVAIKKKECQVLCSP